MPLSGPKKLYVLKLDLEPILNKISVKMEEIAEIKRGSIGYLIDDKFALFNVQKLEGFLKQHVKAAIKTVQEQDVDIKNTEVFYKIAMQVELFDLQMRMDLLELLFSIADKVKLKTAASSKHIYNILLNESFFKENINEMQGRFEDLCSSFTMLRASAISREWFYFQKRIFFARFAVVEKIYSPSRIKDLHVKFISNIIDRFIPKSHDQKAQLQCRIFYTSIYDIFAGLIRRSSPLQEQDFAQCQNKNAWEMISKVQKLLAKNLIQTNQHILDAFDCPKELADLIINYHQADIEPLTDELDPFDIYRQVKALQAKGIDNEKEFVELLERINNLLKQVRDFKFDQFGLEVFEAYTSLKKDLARMIDQAIVFIDGFQKEGKKLQEVPLAAKNIFEMLIQYYPANYPDPYKDRHLLGPLYCLLLKIEGCVTDNSIEQEPRVNAGSQAFYVFEMTTLSDLMRSPAVVINYSQDFMTHEMNASAIMYILKLQLIYRYVISISKGEFFESLFKQIEASIVKNLKKHRSSKTYPRKDGYVMAIINIAQIIIHRAGATMTIDMKREENFVAKNIKQLLSKARTKSFDEKPVLAQIDQFFSQWFGPYQLMPNMPQLVHDVSQKLDSMALTYVPAFQSSSSSACSSASMAVSASASSRCPHHNPGGPFRAL